MTQPQLCCHWGANYQQNVFSHSSSSSRMRVMNHNWSATKQHLHPQSVADISRHSVLSGDRIDNVGHRLGLTTRTQISVCKSPFPSAGTTVSVPCKNSSVETAVAEEVKTRLRDCGVWLSRLCWHLLSMIIASVLLIMSHTGNEQKMAFTATYNLWDKRSEL